MANYLFVNAQPWMHPPYLNIKEDNSRQYNFYEIQKAFKAYEESYELTKGSMSNIEDEEENGIPGETQYKRWEWYMEPRVYPSGDISLPTKNWEEFQNYLNANSFDNQRRQSMSGNWTALGPTVPTYGGAGRINFIRFDPVDTNIIWAGAASGGLWKSIDGGASWSTNTDQLSVIGCADIVIDPTNTNIMYLATGDSDNGATHSIGVLKSTDGGTTWDTTGLSWPVYPYGKIFKLLMHPNNSSFILAATRDGIYKTTDAGDSWTQTQYGNFTDIEFKPGDPTIVYAVSSFSFYNTAFYKSTNSATSFVKITAGLPNDSLVRRLAIGVTPANPNYVYVLSSGSGVYGSNGFYGLYQSFDSGDNFYAQSNSPNIIGSYGWYNLSIAVNPFNENDVYVGGLVHWRSTDGGINWTQLCCTHVDIHALEFLPGSSTTIFSGNDGGVYKSTDNGTTWTDISNNLQIAQMYRLGTSATDSNLVLTGHQDNGTNRLNSGSWREVYGGDGMECLIDYTNSNIMYAESQYGHIGKSTNGGATFYNIVSGYDTVGIDKEGPWVTPYILHPTDNSTLLVGKDHVYRSTDGGASWSQVGTVSDWILSLAYALSNPDYIYAASNNNFYVSIDGNTFFDRSGALPFGYITYIAVSDSDPNKVWITLSGYSSGNKVYASNDAGISWSNYSTGLPNLPANCIVYQNGSNDGLYVGTDVGVYFRSNSMSSWQPYFDGLPNVVVDELEIQYSAKKLRAATYGRGLWESDLAIPSADFTASNITVCLGDTITFTDQSGSNPTSWNWSFPGGDPSSSTLQNPTVTYNTAGSFDVTLSTTNTNGSSSKTKANYIVPSAITLTTTKNDVSCNGGDNGNASVNASGGTPFICNTQFSIGTETNTLSSTSYPAPYGNWYWGAKHQMLFLASELQAQGFNAGQILSLALDIASISGTSSYDDFEIKMDSTSSTSITSFQTGLTTVYMPQNITIASGWNTYTFDTPFEWNGLSNILIEICFNDSSYTYNSPTYYSPTAFTSVVYYRNDLSNICSSNTITGISMNRPNIRFTTTCDISEPYHYNWSTGDSTSTIMNLHSGIYYVTASDANNCTTSTAAIINEPTVDTCSGILLNIKAYLGGSYSPNNGLMNDDLRMAGYISLTEPYSGIFTQIVPGGGEVIDTAVLLVSDSNAIADWIFIELRDKTDSTKILATRSALIQKDGNIVDVDGISSLKFEDVAADDYYVVIRHRNHLGVMTANPVSIDTSTDLIDFTDPATPTYFKDAPPQQLNNGTGKMVLWLGEVVADGYIKYSGSNNDRDSILVKIGGAVPTNTVPGYNHEDVNLDGYVKYSGAENDRDIILQNIGGLVPTATIPEQLP